jgi:hypothetical protein
MSPLRADLSGGGTAATATAAGITVQAEAPVLALCRRLLAAGHDPGTPLEAYRGDTLCLRVRSIGEGATLAINDGGFQRYQPPARRRRSCPYVASPPLAHTDLQPEPENAAEASG